MKKIVKNFSTVTLLKATKIHEYLCCTIAKQPRWKSMRARINSVYWIRVLTWYAAYNERAWILLTIILLSLVLYRSR